MYKDDVMKKILIFVISILLLACNPEDKTTTNIKIDTDTQLSQLKCIDNISTGNSGNRNNIDLQILELIDGVSSIDTAMEGVVVQLDNDGICIKSNAEGFVTFSAVSNGEHDIHIFSPEGYGWISFYNITIGQFRKIDLRKINKVDTTPKSYISLQGAVSNVISGNKYSIFFITDTGKKYQGLKLNATLNTLNNYAVDFEFPLVAGSSVIGDLIAFEYKNDPATSESTLVDIATATLSSLTLTTKIATGSYSSNNTVNNLNFKSVKHNIRNKLSIDNIIVPEQLQITSLAINGHKVNTTETLLKPNIEFFSFNDLTKTLVFPRVFSFINHFRFNEFHLSILATSLNDDQKIWTYSNKYIKNGPAFTLTPQITRLPVISDNQVGNLITWDSVNQKLDTQEMWIGFLYNGTVKTSWTLILNPKATSLTLPKIPSGVTSVLRTDINYEIRLNGTIGADPSGYTESFSVNSKMWKP